MEITILVFSIDAFPFFFNLWMTETKHDKHNFKRGLSMWKMRKSTEKINFKFCKLTFLWVSNEIIYKFS